MTPITRQDILSHQTVEPWAAQYQVEQDLLLCRAMVALFTLFDYKASAVVICSICIGR
jgi:hypothetical protein